MQERKNKKPVFALKLHTWFSSMAATKTDSNKTETTSDVTPATSTKSDDDSEFKIDGEMIVQGAEAKVYKVLWEQTKMTIVKHRMDNK